MLKKARTERFIWLDIAITLLVLELMSYFYYGIRALFLGAVCVAASLAADFISLRIMNKRFTADDLTCTSDALIIALMLPAVFDYGIAAAACILAMTAAKNIFGGRHNMIFSPAAVAYVFLFTSWEQKLLHYPQPHAKFGIFEKTIDLVSSLSHDFNLSGKADHTDFELLLGNFSGPAGSVSVLILLIAAVMLLFRGDISAGAFIGTIFGTEALAYAVPASNNAHDSVKYTLICNMVLFAAIYIVADKRIAPKRNSYAFFYGLLVGAVSYIIVLTTAKENAIVIVSVLFTPVALALRELEDHIEKLAAKADADQEAADDDNADKADISSSSEEYTAAEDEVHEAVTENAAKEADIHE